MWIHVIESISRHPSLIIYLENVLFYHSSINYQIINYQIINYQLSIIKRLLQTCRHRMIHSLTFINGWRKLGYSGHWYWMINQHATVGPPNNWLAPNNINFMCRPWQASNVLGKISIMLPTTWQHRFYWPYV